MKQFFNMMCVCVIEKWKNFTMDTWTVCMGLCRDFHVVLLDLEEVELSISHIKVKMY